jgi:hypothetical protein
MSKPTSHYFVSFSHEIYSDLLVVNDTEIRSYTIQGTEQNHPHTRPSSEPQGPTRQQATAKALSKRSTYQIHSVIIVLVSVILVFQVQFVSLIPKRHKKP